MEYIQAKTILSKVKNAPDSWFGLTYNMNLYRGCQHQCIYCDSRSECYQIKDFSNIQVKQNAIELLVKEIKSKRLKGTIGTGSMNDPYMPIEKTEMLTQKALGIIQEYKFPVHVLTKNALVLRDMDLLKQIGKIYAAVSFTITTADDKLSKIIEPGASVSSERFEAIKELSKAGVYCGILLMPVLPFITNTEENILEIINKAKQAGAKYILNAMGMTLRDQQREYYYKKLDVHFPGLKEIYNEKFGNNYSVSAKNAFDLHLCFKANCKKFGLNNKIEIFSENKPEQLSLF